MWRRAVVPLGLCATVGAIAWPLLRGGSREWVAAVFPLGCLGVLTTLEWLAGEERPTAALAPRDLTCLVLSVVLGGAAPFLAVFAFDATGLPTLETPGRWPLLAALVVVLVVGDLLSYLVHRAFHVVPMLWRFHALHHQPRALYTVVAYVEHPVMVLVMRGSRSLLVLACGFSGDVVFAVAMLDAWLGMSSHFGLAVDHPGLARLLVTPSVHRQHHARDVAASGNYGLWLTLWDRVFGTFVAPQPRVPVGLPDGSPLELAWWRLLVLPRPRNWQSGKSVRPAAR